MPNQMAVVFLVTVGFVVVAYMGYSFVDAVWLQKSRVRRRLDNMSGQQQQKQPQAQQTVLDEEERLPTIAGFLSSKGFADKIFLMLLQAGVKLRPSEFVGISAGVAIAFALLAWIFLRSVAGELVGILIGVFGPYAYVKALQAKRLVTFSRQLPDALSLMGSAIRSGYSFPRAMQMVAEEMPAPISEEFRRVMNETNVGMSLDIALTRMCRRIPCYDLELVVTAVIIQQQIGGNLAEIIDNIASTIRERIRIEGEMNALTAEGRISGVILVCMPFAMALIIFLFNPRYLLPLIQSGTGLMMIATGIILMIVGGVIIKKMLVLDY